MDTLLSQREKDTYNHVLDRELQKLHEDPQSVLSPGNTEKLAGSRVRHSDWKVSPPFSQPTHLGHSEAKIQGTLCK